MIHDEGALVKQYSTGEGTINNSVLERVPAAMHYCQQQKHTTLVEPTGTVG